jgi:SulP family sulfate permease
VPFSLVGVALATLAAEAAQWDVARIGALPSALPAPSLRERQQRACESASSNSIRLGRVVGTAWIGLRMADQLTVAWVDHPDVGEADWPGQGPDDQLRGWWADRPGGCGA